MAAKAQALRVNFDNAPPSVLKAIFGVAKDKQAIMQAIVDVGSQAGPDGKANPAVHVKEIFHYVNTDAEGEWILNEAGEPAIGLQSLNRQVTALVDAGTLARVGERTGRYVLAPGVELEADEDEAGDE